MITVDLTDDQVKRARELYEFGELNNSITKGESNIYGALGEIMIYDYFKKDKVVAFSSTYDYDMTIDMKKVDVKTRKITVKPYFEPHWLCGFPTYNTKQKCDYYFFTYINHNLKVGHILGYAGKEEFFEKATLRTKGEKDSKGFVFKSDCYTMPITNLNQFKNG